MGASLAYAGAGAGTGVVNSKHDMRTYAATHGGTADSLQRVCAYCHTPHHAVEDANADYMPLWSRTVTAATFAGYVSTTFSQSASVADPVIGPSRLCMSCHDGVVAIDAYYGATGTATMVGADNFAGVAENHIGVGGDPKTLTNDHPIGFEYALAKTADAEIAADTTTFKGGSVTIGSVLWDNGAGKKMMTCATCHDVHNGPSVVDGAFIYGKQIDSQFCTSCHLK
jgi:hypothetical protein